MAKKKSKGDGGTAKDTTVGKVDKVDKVDKADKASAAAGTSPIERAFAAGNYSDVRAFAKAHPDATAEKLVALTRVDTGQLLVGLVAIVVVLLAALLTLK